MAALEVTRTQVFHRRSSVAPLQDVKNLGAGVVSPGGPDLAELLDRHRFEVGTGGTQLRTVKDRLAGDELREDVGRIALGHGGIVAGKGEFLVAFDTGCRQNSYNSLARRLLL